MILPWKTSRTLMRHDDSTKNDKNGEFRWWKGWCNGQRSRIVGMWISQTLVVSDIACFHMVSRSPTTDMFWGWHGMALKHLNQVWFNWATWRWMFFVSCVDNCPCALPVLWWKHIKTHMDIMDTAQVNSAPRCWTGHWISLMLLIASFTEWLLLLKSLFWSVTVPRRKATFPIVMSRPYKSHKGQKCPSGQDWHRRGSLRVLQPGPRAHIDSLWRYRDVHGIDIFRDAFLGPHDTCGQHRPRCDLVISVFHRYWRCRMLTGWNSETLAFESFRPAFPGCIMLHVHPNLACFIFQFSVGVCVCVLLILYH